MVNLGKYAVLSADIVDSRSFLEDQAVWKEKLTKLNQELTEYFDSVILTPFTLSRGDEIQTILHAHESLPYIIRLLRFYMIPLKLRIGIGFGDVSVNDFRSIESSWNITGTAFYNSRDGLDALKKEKIQITYIKSNNIQMDEIFNGYYSLIDVIESDWSEIQWKAVYLYEKDNTFKKAAKTNNTTPQNIFSAYQRSNFAEVKKVEKIIGKLIFDQ